MSRAYPADQDAIESTDGIPLPQDHEDPHFPKVRYLLHDPMDETHTIVSHLNDASVKEIQFCMIETFQQIKDFDEYLALTSAHMDSVPALDRKAKTIASHFQDVNDLYVEFISNVKRKNKKIEKFLEEIPKLLNDQGQWWEKTNIFSPGKLFQIGFIQA